MTFSGHDDSTINIVLGLLFLLLLCKNNGCDDFLFGVHCVEEGDRIPPLQSYGQALKQENCFSGVLGDDCGASANLFIIIIHILHFCLMDSLLNCAPHLAVN